MKKHAIAGCLNILSAGLNYLAGRLPFNKVVWRYGSDLASSLERNMFLLIHKDNIA